ncbi:MAG: hypothetical protein H8E55_50825 [Pelagibacterales bacterium]|nr:hypothetical protein [Pelagibacterales bacterium]
MIILDKGNAKKNVSSTEMNKQSSRSHTIFSLNIAIKVNFI